MGNYIFVIGLLAYCKMKSKLAVFDYDSTIRDNDLDDDWQMGVGHLFPKGKVPEHLHVIRQKEGPRVFLEHVKDSINKVGVTKEQLEDGFANKIGFLVEKMDDVIKMLHPDHDIIIITGSYRNYTDSFLKRFGLFENIISANGEHHVSFAIFHFARKLSWNYSLKENITNKSNILGMVQMIYIQP